MKRTMIVIFCTGNFDGDNLGRFANLEEVKLYLERTGILD